MKNKYAQTEQGWKKHLEAKDRWRISNPKRRSAHIAVGNAIRDGYLIPWTVCSIPECNGKPQAHHPDYDRPLDVVWLCPAHHKEAHVNV